jgi:hypothetical protein
MKPDPRRRIMGDDLVKDVAGRVTRLEDATRMLTGQVSGILERLNHLPTKAGLWRMVALAAGGVILAMWGMFQYLAKPWIEHILTTSLHP